MKLVLKSWSPFVLAPLPLGGADSAYDRLFTEAALAECYSTKIEPRGGRGFDRLGVETFAPQAATHLAIASRKAIQGTYHFSPYLEKLILRGSDRFPRRISVPCLRDRVVLHQLKLFLDGNFPGSVERRLPNEFIRLLRSFAGANELSTLGVLRTDIRNFFDCVQHTELLAQLRTQVTSERAIALLRKAIRNPTVAELTPRRESRKRRSLQGVPQGLSISNLLAAIYLRGVDDTMSRSAPLYLRFVDDIVLLAPITRLAQLEARLRVELATLNLELNDEKTTSGPVADGFAYLGYLCELPAVRIPRTAAERFLRMVAARFSSYQHRTRNQSHPSWLSAAERRAAFIEELNEKITGAINGTNRYGWLFYYCETDDVSLLHQMDAAIGRMFRRLPDFRGQPLGGLKRLSRAYFEAKYSPTSGYIVNYNAFDTPPRMLAYLVRRGIIDPSDGSRLSVEQVRQRFTFERERRLSELDRDVGLLY